MAETPEDEYWRLQTEVTKIETYVANGMVAGNHAVSSMLLTFLDGAQKRLAQLEQEGVLVPDVEKRQKAEREGAAVRYLVEKETALNQDERAEYASFLERNFFTRNDFGRLESFYAKSWDRLSEDGQANMSQRVWEGVRREEYQFSELPEVVKQKEAERLHQMLVSTKREAADLERVPMKDRSDFVHSWESGRRLESYQILDRPCFRRNMALSSGQVASVNEAEERATHRADIATAQEARTEAPTKSPLESEKVQQISDDLLGELKSPAVSTDERQERDTVSRQ